MPFLFSSSSSSFLCVLFVVVVVFINASEFDETESSH